MTQFQITTCTCNYQENPMGIEESPVFSWKMISSLQGDYQTASRIVVTEEHTSHMVWDSGRIDGSSNLSVPYEGEALKPRTRYHWQVTSWNREGHETTSADSWFETGKMTESWNARWIGAPWCKLDRDDEAAPYFRKTFTLDNAVKKARLYICGLGVYEAWLEGRRVSDIVLDPAYTKYDAEALYRVYDVTEYLIDKRQATLGIILGNSWYNCFTKDAWNAPQSTWRAVPKLICELYVEYEDGSTQCIVSDTSWKTSKGPIQFNSIRSGEHYDARLELGNWSESNFDESEWKPVIQLRTPGGILKAAQGAPIREIERRAAVRSYLTEEGHRIFDFGQNMAGKAEITIHTAKGSEFILRYAEELTADGKHVDQSHLRCFIREGEFQTDHYIAKGADSETWSCRFVYHGFRYVELEALGAAAADAEVTAIVMHTDLKQTAYFHCSDEGLNTIQHLCRWSTYSNVMGIPASDPHREKNAWTGDNGFAAEQLLINFDSLHLMMQWLDSVCDCQRIDGAIPCVCPSTGWGFNWGNGPDWSLVLSTLPWLLYRQTGNKQILEKYYPYIAKHFEFMRSMAVDGVVSYGIGDWCAPFEGAAVSVNMESFKAPTPLTDTACYYESADILDRMSQILGYENPYATYKEEIRQTIASKFVTEDGMAAGDCQTSDGCIAWNHIVSPELEEMIVERLANRIIENGYHLDFGVLGQRYVMESLGDHGYVDVLYRMLSQDTYPSYLYLAKNGCTTLTECWNLGGSHNHVMFSHVSSILYQYIAGIYLCNEVPGMTHVIVRPSLVTDAMDCAFDTPNGLLKVNWEKKDQTFWVTVQIPFGTTAQLLVPPCVEEEQHEIQLESGIYSFAWKK